MPQNDFSRSYNVLNEKCNLTIRKRCHLIQTNKKFIVKQDYEIIKETAETPSRETVVPPRTNILSNVVAPSVRTNSGLIIGNLKRCLKECWIAGTYDSVQFDMFVEYLLTEHIELFHKQKSVKLIFNPKSLNSKRGTLHY